MSTIGNRDKSPRRVDDEFPARSPSSTGKLFVLLAASMIIVGIGFGVAGRY